MYSLRASTGSWASQIPRCTASPCAPAAIRAGIRETVTPPMATTGRGVVEWGGEVVERGSCDEVQVRDGDSIELVQFVGGG